MTKRDLRQRWLDLRAAWHQMFDTTWSHDDEPASIAEDTAARTAWIRAHRREEDS